MGIRQIELGGIVRNLPDNTVPDGSMQELINLRPRDGALRPVGLKVKSFPAPRNVIYIHQINESTKVYIGYLATGYLAYWVYVNDSLFYTDTAFMSFGMNQDLVCIALGSILLVSNRTAETTTLFSYNIDTALYTAYADTLPEIPFITYSRAAVVSGNEVTTTIETFDITNSKGVKTFVNAEYLKMQNKKATAGYLTGVYLVRNAIELVDTTLVRHSLPGVVTLSSITQTVNIVVNTGGSGNTQTVTVVTTFTAYNLQYQLNGDVSWMNDLKSRYKDLVKGLNFYISRTVTPPEDLLTYDSANYPPDIDVPDYFLLKEEKLEDLSLAAKAITRTNVAEMATWPMMTVDSFTHHKLYGSRLFSYNGRIFLGDVKNYLYKGVPTSSYISPVGTAGPAYSVGFEFDLTTAQGTKTVFSGWADCNTYTSANLMYRQFQVAGSNGNYWGYPDSRAKTARLLIKNGETIYKIDELDLTPVLELNFSYFQGYLAILTQLLNSYPTTTLKANADSYYDHNRIQACELDNPFYYPAKNSYRVQGRVLGMSTNAIALSQGQFGQFPVYCFTSEGIWTMNIGNGDVLINTITPLSREVCNRPETITQIDGGTVFSTSKGLYILQGTQAIEISQPAEGNCLGRITGTLNYEAIANNPNLYQIKDFLCNTPLIKYLQGAKIGWDHTEGRKEIIISNPDPKYNYSWVYSLLNKKWFKISQVFENFISDYPETYGYRNVVTTTKTTRKAVNNGLFYNWNTISYNIGGASIAPAGWHVPTFAEWWTMIQYIQPGTTLGRTSSVGDMLKQIGLAHWNAPNSGATNSYGFNGYASGMRLSSGDFSGLLLNTLYWCADSYDSTLAHAAMLSYNNAGLDVTGGTGTNVVSKASGCSVRCIKNDSNDTGIMTDIDGYSYKTVKIGNQVWMAENLKVTHFNDGVAIPEVRDGNAWANLSTPGLAALNNDWGTVMQDIIQTESVTDYTRFTMSEEDYTELIPVHMETRPVKLSPAAFKKVHRSIIEGYINNNSDFPFSVNLFGSPDKRNWYLMNASNTFGARSQLIIGRTTFSCMYYILVIGGKVDEDAYFTGVSVDFDEVFNNKLR